MVCMLMIQECVAMTTHHWKLTVTHIKTHASHSRKKTFPTGHSTCQLSQYHVLAVAMRLCTHFFSEYVKIAAMQVLQA